jgi:hypothetical protein
VSLSRSGVPLRHRGTPFSSRHAPQSLRAQKWSYAATGFRGADPLCRFVRQSSFARLQRAREINTYVRDAAGEHKVGNARGRKMRLTRTSALAIIGLALVAAWTLARRNHRVMSPISASSPETPKRWLPFPFGPAESRDQDETYFAVSGRVHSKAGKPLSDAMACAFCAECDPTQNRSDPVCEPPDASGRYVLQRLKPGDYQVSLAASGHRPRIANRGEPIHLRGKDVELPDAELEEGGARVTGTVSDATGGPVIGATVQASFESDDLPLGRYASQVTKSDGAGSYRLSVPQGHVLLIARADGYAEARVGTQAPAEGIHLVVTPSSRISGTVVAQPELSPVAGMRVIAHGEFGFEQVTTSDNAGAFTVAGLRSGIYSLDASGDGWVGRHSGTVTVDISDAAENIVIPVVRAARVTGTMSVGDEPCRSGAAYLTPAPGQPLPQLTAHANLSGQIAFEAVPPGSYHSAALCDGYGKTEGAEVQVAGTNLTGLSWQFDKGINVIVRASTREGKPVAGAAIAFTPAPDGSASRPAAATPRFARTNADGFYRFLGIAEGSYVLGGPEVENPMRVEVRATSSPTEFVVTLKPVGGIEVVVKDAKGRSNDAVAVMVTAKTGLVGGGGIGQPLGGGRFHIGPLAPGEYQVEMRDGVDPVLSANGPEGAVHVRAGEITQVEATYGGHSGRIAGRVLDSAGMPLENVWVTAQPSGTDSSDIGQMLSPLTHATERRSLTNSEGRFVIDGLLETGVFSVVASHALGGEARIDSVAAGQNVDLTLSAPGRLGGVVLDSSGRPATHFQIVIGNKESAQHLVPEFGPDSKGRWVVDHVAPGTIEIRAQSPEGIATVVRELRPSQRMEDIELRLQPSASAPN